MSFTQAKNILNTLAKQIDDNEKICLPIFANKLKVAAQENEYDSTIVGLSKVIGKVAESKTFITRAELKKLYNQFYSRNTKFAKIFEEELGHSQEEESKIKYANRPKEGDLNLDFSKYVDENLSNALNYAMGNVSSYKKYTSVAEQSALEACKRAFEGIRVSALNVKVASGQEDVLICKASFETPKGLTSVFLPVEIVNEKALNPNTFVGNNGAFDLNKKNVNNYILSQAGKGLGLDPTVLLKATSEIKNPTKKLSNVEIAIAKMALEKKPEEPYFSNNIVGQKVDEKDSGKEVSIPTFVDEEFNSFATQLESPLGQANFKFGREKVASVYQVVGRTVESLGFGKPQLAVYSCNNNSLTYAVSLLGNKSFKVPVTIKEGKVSLPTVMIVNGSVKALNKEELSKLGEEQFDFRAAATTSSLNGLKPSDLIDLVEKAVDENNYAKAEDALNVLATMNDAKAYKSAISAYKNGLSNKKAEPSKCNFVVNASNSKHKVCGHTNLPLHKVYQDKYGDCHPLYRKAMEQSELATTNNFYQKLFYNK